MENAEPKDRDRINAELEDASPAVDLAARQARQAFAAQYGSAR